MPAYGERGKGKSLIKPVRAAVTAVLAAPLLAIAFAMPANAAAGDVNLTADVQGNDVWVTISNDSAGIVGCEWRAWDDDIEQFQASVRYFALPGESWTSAPLPDGDYKISWWCADFPNADEWWGTGDIEMQADTADPTPVTAPIPVDTGIFGSLGSSETGSLGSS
ncbi:hypothetical protein BFN03_16690 [Rhodococcus sp. WMMA185]|nr:hypothetical protein BFN03_16690 [Rhodococcus sp. WMMA185]